MATDEKLAAGFSFLKREAGPPLAAYIYFGFLQPLYFPTSEGPERV